ncbi:hypothetical protein [Citreimonas salinaria]|nr:hypothetical protein [Citreimonas salinaria]
MKNVSIENFAILDFEASSLSAASWPIEIGLSWLANGQVQTWSSFIRPDPAWDLGDWSSQSAEVHGIPLSELEDAPYAAEVAEAFLNVVGRRSLVSDAPEFEERWLSRLLRTTRHVKSSSIEDFDAVSFAVFSGYALDMLYETIERHPAPHRAGPDTARLARGWLRATALQEPE